MSVDTVFLSTIRNRDYYHQQLQGMLVEGLNSKN